MTQKEQKIESVSDYIKKVTEYVKEEKDNDRNHTFFFRGHSDKEYKLEPSIFRKKDKDKNTGKWVEDEHKITNDMFISSPAEFANCDNLFDKLVKLQHYECPTRLLDITPNALVALYFACRSHQKDNDENGKDGKVFLFKILNNEINVPNGDKVSILSALSLQDKNFYTYSKMTNITELLINNELYNVFSKFGINNDTQNDVSSLFNMFRSFICVYYQRSIDEYTLPEKKRRLKAHNVLHSIKNKLNPKIYQPDYFIKKFINSHTFFNKDYKLLLYNIVNLFARETDSSIESIKDEKLINDLAEIIQIIESKKCHNEYLKELEKDTIGKLVNKIKKIEINYFCSHKSIKKLLNDIRKDKPYFEPLINHRDFYKVLCVTPNKSNQRLIHQDGAFLLFGMGEEKEKYAKILPANIPKDWQQDKNYENMEIIIPAESKTQILEELKYLGISQATLFPELDKQAEAITQKYKERT